MKIKYELKLFKKLLIILLVAHFSIVALYLMPENPIQHQYKYKLNSYMLPVFGQTWKLFAPNPINSNLSLLVKFYDYKNGKIIESSWLDIYQPLVDERREHFWSPSQRILKSFSGSIMNLLDNRKKILEYISKEDENIIKGDTASMSKLLKQAINISAGHKLILSYSEYTHAIYLSQNKIRPDSSFVRYRILESKFPRFSQRNLDYFDLKNYKYSQLISALYKINQ